MSATMVGRQRYFFFLDRIKQPKQHCFSLFHLIKNIGINNKCTVIVHKLRHFTNWVVISICTIEQNLDV